MKNPLAAYGESYIAEPVCVRCGRSIARLSAIGWHLAPVPRFQPRVVCAACAAQDTCPCCRQTIAPGVPH